MGAERLYYKAKKPAFFTFAANSVRVKDGKNNAKNNRDLR
ncbi:hypothetical protein SHAM105786_07400 [Shewanella amazonensis]